MFQNKEFISLIPLISVFLVAVLSLVSNFLIIRYNQRQNISNKIIEQYFKIREDICQKVSRLANLKTLSELGENELKEINDEISQLYFKYYDFLPKEVIYELMCLHTNLTDKGNNLYTIDGKGLMIIEGEKLEAFLESVSLINNSKYFICYKLNSEDNLIRKATAINLQARKVLITMNTFFSLENLLKWTKYLRKY